MSIIVRINKRSPSFLTLLLTAMVSLWGSVAFAGDPFRTVNPRQLGANTEAAFNALFLQGDYQEAKAYLLRAESNQEQDPITHAMRASLAYLEEDWENVKIYGQKTITTAERLKTKDSLRSNLYLAVGHFLEGAYIFHQDGAMAAIHKLQLVFDYLDAAEFSDRNDPELNLLKGYLDLILAVNLPFSSPEQAIERLEKYAAPDYLVDRGIAIAYRDLAQYEQALSFVELAMAATPDNPELYYLKAQILRKIGNNSNDTAILSQALTYFEKALNKEKRLPESIQKTLRREYEKTQKKINELNDYRLLSRPSH